MRQAIQTKFLGATNYRGSRVKAWCEGGSHTLEWDYAVSPEENHLRAAMALQSKLGWHTRNALIGGSTAGGYVFVQVERDGGQS